MEAPDKIYLQCCGDCPQTDCDGCKFEDLEDMMKKDLKWIGEIQYDSI